jgi:hypothetical protein
MKASYEGSRGSLLPPGQTPGAHVERVGPTWPRSSTACEPQPQRSKGAAASRIQCWTLENQCSLHGCILGGSAAGAEAEEADFALAEPVAGGLVDSVGEVPECLFVEVGDGAASFADEVVMRVVPGRFVVGTVGAQVGAEDESFVDEEIERSVDGGRVDLGELPSNAFDDVFGAEVAVGFGEERVPDRLPLASQPPAFRTEARRVGRGGVSVGLTCGHGTIMPPTG